MDAPDPNSPSPSEARLLTATLHARNTEVITRVVDDSITRSRELRKEREARDLARREQERRAARIEATEEAERRDAEEASARIRDQEARQENLDALRRSEAADLLTQTQDRPQVKPLQTPFDLSA